MELHYLYSEKDRQGGSRIPSNHANFMVTRHPNNGLQDLGTTKNNNSYIGS